MPSFNKKKNIVKLKVSIIGLGYIGLPTFLLLSEKLVNIFGYDTNQKKIDTIKKGKFKFHENDLNTIYKRLFFKKKIYVSNKLKQSDIYLITVQTPIKKNYKPDLSYLTKAIKDISKVLKKNNLIIIESTSPVGTINKMIKKIKSLRSDLFKDNIPQFNISYCPERLLPGNTVKELKNNSRIIGGLTSECCKKSALLYRLFSSSKFYYTDSQTAELSKIAENTYRDINIAYANYLKIYCDKINIDVSNLIKLSNIHPRVNIHQSGIGVGGHCIPVDPLFLLSQNKKNIHDKLIISSRKINDFMPNYTIENIMKHINKKIIKKTKITILGVTYKPNTDDYRNSPAIKIVLKLNKIGFKCLNFCDPNIDNNILRKHNINQINLKNLRENSDVILKLVNHKEFKNLKFKKDEIKLIDFSN